MATTLKYSIMRFVIILIASSICSYASILDKDYEENPATDLATYVSLPAVRPPILEVKKTNGSVLSPGYILMSPYTDLTPASVKGEFQPYQGGPAIFDNSGELIWTGYDVVGLRNVFDFRLATLNGTPVFTLLADSPRNDDVQTRHQRYGVILDMNYEIIHQVPLFERFNMHEFNVLDEGIALVMTSHFPEVNVSVLGYPMEQTGVLASNGFREVDVNSNRIIYEWRAENHIGLEEVISKSPRGWPQNMEPFDCFHINSLDKFKNGDYLISVRHTSSIYRISGINGSVIWRLGGKFSDFTQNFNFSSQHDARIVSVNDTTTIISFFDNASDDRERRNDTALVSSMKVVALYDQVPHKEAQLLNEVDRPDGELTRKRGQAQILPNGGFFAGWSDKGYVTEHDPDGKMLLEAQFMSSRFATYRAYKFDFQTSPVKPPVLKTQAFGYNKNLRSQSTVFYVTWNGATEVASWRFWGTNDMTKPFRTLGEISRGGFETTFISHYLWAFAQAEALDKDHNSLGLSDISRVVLPNTFGNLEDYLEVPGQSESGVLGKLDFYSAQAKRFSVIGALGLVAGLATSLLIAIILSRRCHERLSSVEYEVIERPVSPIPQKMVFFKSEYRPPAFTYEDRDGDWDRHPN